MTAMSSESAGSAATPCGKTPWWTPQLAGPVIAAAVVRLTLLAAALRRVGSSAFFSTDTSGYLEPGRNLLLHGRFISDGIPELFRTPGYPLFLAITSLAGPIAAVVANVILSVFSVLLVWRLGRTAFGEERIALGAAWLFAFEPLSVAHSILLLSDTLFLALFLLSLEHLAEFLRSRRLRLLATAGLWLAAATFVRPVTYYLPVALALGLIVVLARDSNLRWKAPAVLLVCVLPWLAAWQIRNWVEAGYGGFSSITDENLYFYSTADLIAHVEHRNFVDVQNELDARCGRGCGEPINPDQHDAAQNPEQAGLKQGPRLAFMRSESLRVIRAHFGVYLSACITHFFEAALYPGAGSFDSLLYPKDPRHIDGLIAYKGPTRGSISLAKSYPWAAAEKAAFVAVLLALYLLAARGVFRAGMHNACLWLLLGTSLYFLAASSATTGPGATARYRLPVMPAVCILATAGFPRAKARQR